MKKQSKFLKVYTYDWFNNKKPKQNKMNPYCSKCSNSSNDNDIKIKSEINGKINLYSY